MRRATALVGIVIVTLSLGPSALAGLFSKKPVPEAEPIVAPPPPDPGPPSVGRLFTSPLPLSLGPMPVGLANQTSQGCNGCHYEATDGWQGSAHHQGWRSPELRQAAADAGGPACLSCHLPLKSQHVDQVLYDGGAKSAPRTRPNPAYDASLHIEGVTCAACHVRDGAVVGSAPSGPAPHAGAWSEDLASAEVCASCHQLTWPGADRPFYDTYGEWSRSPQGKAGISCQGCHMRPGADSGLATHDMALPTARAVSLLLHVSAEPLVRGQTGKPIEITLQNTGAGHDFPTGSPYQGIRLEVALIGPNTKVDGTRAWGETFTVDLTRTISPSAPWNTLQDTRLPAGAHKTWSWAPNAPIQAPSGDWSIRATLRRTVQGKEKQRPILLQEVPLRVQ